MEHSLLKSLLSKDFYESTKNLCTSNLFTKDLRKIKQVVDNAMSDYQRDLQLDEVKGLFFTSNPTLTTSQKQQFNLYFKQIECGRGCS